MASGVELFRLMARLVLDTSEFDEGIDGAKDKAEGLGGAFSGAESGVTKLSSALNVLGKVGGAVSNGLKTVVDAGMGLVETSASLDALEQSMASTFEGVESEASAALERVGEANNIAMLRMQESGLSFFRQFTSAGMDSENALLNMETALGYAADAAAAYDISLEDAGSMIRSFLRGNVEAGESIGLFISQLTREKMAMEQYYKAWQDLNEAERQFLLLDVVGKTYEQSKVAGQGAREMTNWSNVVGNLSSVWTEAQAMMGDEIREALIPALMDLTKWIEDNPELWEGLGETFGHIATAMVGAFKSLMTFITNNEDKIIGFIDSLNFLFSGGYAADFTNKPRAQGSDEEKRKAALAYLMDEGLFSDVEKVFGGSNAATRYLLDKRNDFGDEAPTQEVAAQWVDEAMAELQSDLDKANLTATVDMKPDFSGFLSTAGSWLAAGAKWLFDDRPDEGQGAVFNAKGLDYVPFDDYPAMLHRGETVLNRVEAEDWRATKRGDNMSFDPAAIGDAVKAALAGVSTSMDGRTVGSLVTPYVSREQAAEAWRRR